MKLFATWLLAFAAALGHASRMVSQDFLQTSLGSIWSLAPSLEGKGHKGLCDPTLVELGCRSLDLGSGVSDDSKASVSEISETLSATVASTLNFLSEIGIKVDFNDKAETISCQELCTKVKESIGPAWLPPASDVACRADSKAGVICDVDLSLEAMEAVKFDDEHEDHDFEKTIDGDGQEESLAQVRQGRDLSSGVKDKSLMQEEAEEAADAAAQEASSIDLILAGMLTDVPAKDASFRVANLFHMYPFVAISVDMNEEEPGLSSRASLLERRTKQQSSGQCQEAMCSADRMQDFCKFGSLCGGCETCKAAQIGALLEEGADGDPVPIVVLPDDDDDDSDTRPSWVPTGDAPIVMIPEDEEDMPPRGGGGAPVVIPDGPIPVIPTVNIGGPSPSIPVPAPTPPPAPTATTTPFPVDPNWQDEIAKVSIKAQAYVARALQEARMDKKFLVKWAGEDTPLSRAHQMKSLNSVSNMLANVEYQLGGSVCTPNTLAYVYPDYGSFTKNERGQYIFYMCELFFSRSEGRKIETLTHEGSHHASAFLADSCVKWYPEQIACTKVYGRMNAERAAELFPKEAQMNADNFCYYVNDLNGHPESWW